MQYPQFIYFSNVPQKCGKQGPQQRHKHALFAVITLDTAGGPRISIPENELEEQTTFFTDKWQTIPLTPPWWHAHFMRRPKDVPSTIQAPESRLNHSLHQEVQGRPSRGTSIMHPEYTDKDVHSMEEIEDDAPLHQ